MALFLLRGSTAAPQRLRCERLHDPAMPVRHVFAEANIAHHHQIRNFAFDRASRLLHDAVVRPRAGRDFIFFLRQAKQNYRRHPQRMSFARFLTASSTERLNTPGIERTSLRTPSPGHTNNGYTNASGVSRVSQHHVSEFRGASKAAEASYRECHGGHQRKATNRLPGLILEHRESELLPEIVIPIPHRPQGISACRLLDWSPAIPLGVTKVTTAVSTITPNVGRPPIE